MLSVDPIQRPTAKQVCNQAMQTINRAQCYHKNQSGAVVKIIAGAGAVQESPKLRIKNAESGKTQAVSGRQVLGDITNQIN